jgi:hypothetical protein
MSMSWWSASHVVRVRFICVTPFLMAMLGACGAEAVKEVVLPAEPKFIDAAFPPALVIDDAWYDLDPYVGDAGGHRIVELSVAISAGPSGVVEIEGTRVRCKASGDGIVRFSSGTLESQHKLTCMPIKRIDVKHPSVQLWTGADGVALGARAVNEKGVLVPGVDVERTVLNPDVVRLDGDSVHPIQVGRTAIKLAAGNIERSIDVVVGARYDHRIKVPDGERWALSLSPGAYTVDTVALDLVDRAGARQDTVPPPVADAPPTGDQGGGGYQDGEAPPRRAPSPRSRRPQAGRRVVRSTCEAVRRRRSKREPVGIPRTKIRYATGETHGWSSSTPSS